MSFLLTQNAELLFRKLILLDINDVPYNRRQLLSSYSDIMRFLIKLLTQGCPSTRDRSCLMKYIIQRIIANMPAALYQHALALVSTGQCAAAIVHLNRAIIRGHLPSRALVAWMQIEGRRKNVAKDWNGAFELVEEGARLGCHHCQGIMAYQTCYMGGVGIKVEYSQSRELACKSSLKNSRYGLFVLGGFCQYGRGGVAQNYAQAAEFYRLAAMQGLDKAQYRLGIMYSDGIGVTQDYAEGLRWYQLAATQGHPEASYEVARYYRRSGISL